MIRSLNGMSVRASTSPQGVTAYDRRSILPASSGTGAETKPRIIARMFGGIGNQLFIYSAARALALRNSADLWLDATSGFERDPYNRNFALAAFQIRARICPMSLFVSPKMFGRMFRTVLRASNSVLPPSRRSYLVEPRSHGPALLKRLQVRGRVILEGYWQDEEYFSDWRHVVAEDLKFKADRVPSECGTAKAIVGCASVSVHIRRYDDLMSVSGSAAPLARLPRTYFLEAIEAVKCKVPDARFFIFSDNEPWARDEFSSLDSGFVVSPDPSSDWRDLWMMSLCQHHVLSNSTFSWWGRWLRNASGGVVVAPARSRWRLSIHVPTLPSEWQAILV